MIRLIQTVSSHLHLDSTLPPDSHTLPQGLPMLWGADGLFDAEMDQLFFGLT